MKRCVRSIVQAAITNTKLDVTNTVNRAKCRTNKFPSFTFAAPVLLRRSNIIVVADVQKIGPVQLLAKVRMPTATTLYPLTPL